MNPVYLYDMKSKMTIAHDPLTALAYQLLNELMPGRPAETRVITTDRKLKPLRAIKGGKP